MISTEEPWLYRVFSPVQLATGRFGVLEPDSCRADDRGRIKKVSSFLFLEWFLIVAAIDWAGAAVGMTAYWHD